MPVTLSPQEQLALGGLLRTVVRLDGQFTAEERAAIDNVGHETTASCTTQVGETRVVSGRNTAAPAS